MATLLPLLVVAFAVLAAVSMARHREPARRALALRRAGSGWMVAFGVLGGLFIGGETFSDPGGFAAAGMVLGWLVPLIVMAALAWWRPRLAEPLLMVLVVVVIAYCVWSAVGSHGVGGLRDQRAPYAAVGVFVVSVALGFLGLHRPRAAGLMLLATSLLPVVVEVVGSGAPLRHAFSGSLGAASLPGLVTAGLFLLAHHESTRRRVTTRGPLPAPPR
ncbi:hypothetical protein [Angustibacter sp. Root456]|uniref:hypothetical protein n=1 Tax=Angustibacter sp. Root456 TaxID=1736539 RepID=UPI0006FF1C5E|nr:hypothetical protein [Angustibacter sp. Root456]KQX65602.1 hypothetical protein ASD06_08135 [Angustibacter sp. Root456]